MKETMVVGRHAALRCEMCSGDVAGKGAEGECQAAGHNRQGPGVYGVSAQPKHYPALSERGLRDYTCLEQTVVPVLPQQLLSQRIEDMWILLNPHTKEVDHLILVEPDVVSAETIDILSNDVKQCLVRL